MNSISFNITKTKISTNNKLIIKNHNFNNDNIQIKSQQKQKNRTCYLWLYIYPKPDMIQQLKRSKPCWATANSGSILMASS